MKLDASDLFGVLLALVLLTVAIAAWTRRR